LLFAPLTGEGLGGRGEKGLQGSEGQRHKEKKREVGSATWEGPGP